MRSRKAARTRVNSGATCAAMPAGVSGPVPSAATARSIGESAAVIALRSASCRARADDRAHVDQLGEELMVQRALEKAYAGRAARPRLVADGPFDGLEMPETPELERFL